MKTVTSQQLVTDFIDYQIMRQNNPEKFGLVSTGLEGLDKALGGGIERGQYMIIGGREKSGKTTFAVNVLAKAFGEQGLRFIMFSGEMRNHQVASMLFANLTEIERTKIRSIQLDDNDRTKIRKAGDEISKWNGYWTQGFGTLQELLSGVKKVRESLDKPLDAIFVDYIQLLSDPTVKGNRAQELLSISRQLKLLTNQDEPMIVVATSQLNRDSIRSNIIDRQAYTDAPIERDMDIGLIIHEIKDPSDASKSDTRRRITIVGSREFIKN